VWSGPNPINASQTYQTSCNYHNQYAWLGLPCSVHAQVDIEGKVSLVHTGASHPGSEALSGFAALQPGSRSNFRVRWSDGAFPTAATNCSSASGCRVEGETCICATQAASSAVFTNPNHPPDKSAVLANLHIGSFPPDAFANEYSQCVTAACLAVGNDVAIFTRHGGSFDESTIFRVSVNESARVVHYRNANATVTIVGSPFTFRNPPMFMSVHDASERDAQYETDALIDHLVYHKNTPSFMATRLIQRFTVSNPSPRYVLSVATAFRSGQYDGRTYSGRYGDLAATTAAVLLDREATSAVLDADPSHGGLREPIVKLFHLMRAMEFVAEDGREVELFSLLTSVGQAAYESPTVFSFFLPDFVPAGAVSDAGLISPEAQLANGPLMIGFLNGATSLIRNGLNNCEGGFGASRGCIVSNRWLNPRADGYLTWAPTGLNANTVIDELDLLLTGGSLTERTKRVIATAFHDALNATNCEHPVAIEEACATRAVQVVQELVTATAEFSTFGEPTQRMRPRSSNSGLAPQNRPYKALVVLYMSGGADTFNMLIPHSNCANASGSHDLYGEYAATRSIAAVSRADLLPLDASTSSATCATFGLHPSMPFLKSSYDAGEASFVANVGALVEPTTKAAIQANTVRLPLSLFAHNVQTTAAYTVHAQNKNAAAGVVGRILAALESESAYRTSAWSLSGSKRILEGSRPPWILSRSSGIVEWQRHGELGWYIRQLHANESGSPFAELVGERLTSSIESAQYMGELLDSVTLSTSFPNTDATYATTNTLSQSLEQVAKVIHTRGVRQAERDVFYVQIGGWDTHNEVINALLRNYHLVDRALQAFVTEMRAQGVWNDVAILSASEFGRTLASNGRGTDHGWGGNAFVLGGSVRGGKVHGTYPDSLRADGPNVYRGNSGRVIPTTGWEAVWKALAQWLGVSEASMDTILPNQGNFASNQLFTSDQVFTTASG